jgi:hypothetical protein
VGRALIDRDLDIDCRIAAALPVLGSGFRGAGLSRQGDGGRGAGGAQGAARARAGGGPSRPPPLGPVSPRARRRTTKVWARVFGARGTKQRDCRGIGVRSWNRVATTPSCKKSLNEEILASIWKEGSMTRVFASEQVHHHYNAQGKPSPGAIERCAGPRLQQAPARPHRRRPTCLLSSPWPAIRVRSPALGSDTCERVRGVARGRGRRRKAQKRGRGWRRETLPKKWKPSSGSRDRANSKAASA